jgi:hypothetical protein
MDLVPLLVQENYLNHRYVRYIQVTQLECNMF